MTDWAETAACRGVDPDVFFPEPGDDQSFAKQVCAGCDVRRECLAHAIAHDEVHGIWGGLSGRERARIRRDRWPSRARAVDVDAEWHGTVAGYTNRGCRCDDCRAAYSAYRQVYRSTPEYKERRREQVKRWRARRAA